MAREASLQADAVILTVGHRPPSDPIWVTVERTPDALHLGPLAPVRHECRRPGRLGRRAGERADGGRHGALAQSAAASGPDHAGLAEWPLAAGACGRRQCRRPTSMRWYPSWSPRPAASGLATSCAGSVAQCASWRQAAATGEASWTDCARIRPCSGGRCRPLSVSGFSVVSVRSGRCTGTGWRWRSPSPSGAGGSRRRARGRRPRGVGPGGGRDREARRAPARGRSVRSSWTRHGSSTAPVPCRRTAWSRTR